MSMPPKPDDDITDEHWAALLAICQCPDCTPIKGREEFWYLCPLHVSVAKVPGFGDIVI